MEKLILHKYFGPYFMQSEMWLDTWINMLKKEAKDFYPRESFMMSFYMVSEHLYGLPERATTYLLNVTKKGEPYRLYAIDKFPHEEFDI
jgi:hypothetical protein